MLTKRVKIEQANSALHESDDRLKSDVISFARPSSGLAIADMPPSLDSLIEPTTPDEDDKAIKVRRLCDNSSSPARVDVAHVPYLLSMTSTIVLKRRNRYFKTD